MHLSSMKTALFVDDASKMSRLSTKTSLSMDGVDKEMRLVCLHPGQKVVLRFGNAVGGGYICRIINRKHNETAEKLFLEKVVCNPSSCRVGNSVL